MSFIDEYCTVFDDEEENKLEFTKIHKVSNLSVSLTIRFDRTSRRSSRTCLRS